MPVLCLNDSLPQLCAVIKEKYSSGSYAIRYNKLSSPVLVLHKQVRDMKPRKEDTWYELTLLEACGRVTVEQFQCCHERFFSLYKVE